MFSVGEPLFRPPPSQCPRHPPPSRLNPTYPKPVRGKFQLQFAISWLQRILHFSFPNKRLSFYHEPRNFCSRVPSHLPPSGSRGSAPGIIRYFLRSREIYPCAAREPDTQLLGRLHKPRTQLQPWVFRRLRSPRVHRPTRSSITSILIDRSVRASSNDVV